MAPEEATTSERSIRLLDEIRLGQRGVLRVFGPSALFVLAVIAATIFFVEPPPPDVLKIATCPVDGRYYSAAKEYATLFEKNHLTLDVLATPGSIENYDLLLHDDTINVAIVQGGTMPRDEDLSNIVSLAALYMEPVWVFYRRDLKISQIAELRGKRIVVGMERSGTKLLVMTLLDGCGVQEGVDETKYVRVGGDDGANMLIAGEVDAAFLVTSPDSPIVRKLLLAKQIAVMNFERHHGYARHFPFLKAVTLQEGVVDLEQNLPSRPVKLIAPIANLIATKDLNDAFVPLLLEAAIKTHESGGLLTPVGEYPSIHGVEFPMNEVARHYLRYGPSFFQKHFSFWGAALISRAKIMLVPLLFLLLPFAKIAAPVYRWRIRSRIYRWYAVLRKIDQSLQDVDDDSLAKLHQKLTVMEQELERESVPLAYMEEFYHLRLHIDLVKKRLANHCSALQLDRAETVKALAESDEDA